MNLVAQLALTNSTLTKAIKWGEKYDPAFNKALVGTVWGFTLQQKGKVSFQQSFVSSTATHDKLTLQHSCRWCATFCTFGVQKVAHHWQECCRVNATENYGWRYHSLVTRGGGWMRNEGKREMIEISDRYLRNVVTKRIDWSFISSTHPSVRNDLKKRPSPRKKRHLQERWSFLSQTFS